MRSRERIQLRNFILSDLISIALLISNNCKLTIVSCKILLFELDILNSFSLQLQLTIMKSSVCIILSTRRAFQIISNSASGASEASVKLLAATECCDVLYVAEQRVGSALLRVEIYHTYTSILTFAYLQSASKSQTLFGPFALVNSRALSVCDQFKINKNEYEKNWKFINRVISLKIIDCDMLCTPCVSASEASECRSMRREELELCARRLGTAHEK